MTTARRPASQPMIHADLHLYPDTFVRREIWALLRTLPARTRNQCLCDLIQYAALAVMGHHEEAAALMPAMLKRPSSPPPVPAREVRPALAAPGPSPSPKPPRARQPVDPLIAMVRGIGQAPDEDG